MAATARLSSPRLPSPVTVVSCSPSTTASSEGRLPSRQWAAVTTYLEATSVPPQKWPPPELTRDTIQGYLLI